MLNVLGIVGIVLGLVMYYRTKSKEFLYVVGAAVLLLVRSILLPLVVIGSLGSVIYSIILMFRKKETKLPKGILLLVSAVVLGVSSNLFEKTELKDTAAVQGLYAAPKKEK